MLLNVVASLRGAADARGEHIVAAHMRALRDGEIMATYLWICAVIDVVFLLHCNRRSKASRPCFIHVHVGLVIFVTVVILHGGDLVFPWPKLTIQTLYASIAGFHA